MEKMETIIVTEEEYEEIKKFEKIKEVDNENGGTNEL